MSEKFISNKLTFIVLASACIVILVSMGLRQTFGLFFQAFEESLGVTRTEFGLAIGIQMIFWGIFALKRGLRFTDLSDLHVVYAECVTTTDLGEAPDTCPTTFILFQLLRAYLSVCISILIPMLSPMLIAHIHKYPSALFSCLTARARGGD